MYNGDNSWLYLAMWPGLFAIAALVQRYGRQQLTGLTLTYMLSLSILHWGGGLVHALPWYSQRAPTLTGPGFAQSSYGVLAFCVGALCVAPALVLLGRRQDAVPAMPGVFDRRIPLIYLAISIVSSFILFPLIGALPTVTAILAGLNQLLVVGLGMACWLAWRAGELKVLSRWLLLAALIPLATVSLQGFLGAGAMALITILLFASSFVRSWRRVAVLGLFVAYLGSSFYVTYMRDRSDIRSSVWGGESLGSRVTLLSTTLTTFEWFDLGNQSHLARIDERLNQNVLVGMALLNLAGGYVDFARGETLAQAAVAIVPRALWPEKPVFAGSPDIVSAYTGAVFPEGTSVGVGHVLEFYINFGTPGVVIGMLVLGAALGTLDRLAGSALTAGNWQRFTFWYLPGLGFLHTNGSLVELTSTVAAGFLTAYLLVNVVVPTLLSDRGTRVAPQRQYP